MSKTKRIYKYETRLVERCNWCEGTGRNLKAFIGQPCFVCNGKGGEWKQVKVLVREEVIE
jgi:DnaJ-class molecular chaperone